MLPEPIFATKIKLWKEVVNKIKFCGVVLSYYLTTQIFMFYPVSSLILLTKIHIHYTRITLFTYLKHLIITLSDNEFYYLRSIKWHIVRFQNKSRHVCRLLKKKRSVRHFFKGKTRFLLILNKKLGYCVTGPLPSWRVWPPLVEFYN